MDASLQQWFDEHRRLRAEIRPYYDRIRAKQDSRGSWTSTPTDEEQVLDDLQYFYEAALVNNADVFGYLPYMIEHRSKFEAIGAHGCLAALDGLMPYYEEQQKLNTYDEKNEYWHRTKSDRRDIETLAEETNDFARLLLEFARKNAARIG
jgi:hypothetical protein